MSLQDRIKAQLGELVFQNLALATERDELAAKVTTLEAALKQAVDAIPATASAKAKK